MSQYQWRVGTDDAAWAERFEAARKAGKVTNASGLGKVCFSTAMEHGQAATEAALRNLGTAAVDQDQEWRDRIEQMVTELHHGADSRTSNYLSHQHQAGRADSTKLVVLMSAAAVLASVYLLA
jgi:hypothetical protein